MDRAALYGGGRACHHTRTRVNALVRVDRCLRSHASSHIRLSPVFPSYVSLSPLCPFSFISFPFLHLCLSSLNFPPMSRFLCFLPHFFLPSSFFPYVFPSLASSSRHSFPSLLPFTFLPSLPPPYGFPPLLITPSFSLSSLYFFFPTRFRSVSLPYASLIPSPVSIGPSTHPSSPTTHPLHVQVCLGTSTASSLSQTYTIRPMLPSFHHFPGSRTASRRVIALHAEISKSPEPRRGPHHAAHSLQSTISCMQDGESNLQYSFNFTRGSCSAGGSD